MNFTNRFPYTTLNNINLDWLIKRVKELGTTVRSFAQDIAHAVALAEAAQEAAESVTSTAESAVATAQAAEATANAIAGTANNALATAQAAETTAQAAEATANAIAGTANNALATAQAAETTAQAAEERAQAAEESADNAETIAGTASANASNAAQMANTALSTADAAFVLASQGGNAIASVKAGKLVDTETGAVVSFVPDETIEQNLSVNVAVEPVQAGSGDPSPDNVRPISGWDNVNIWNKPTHDTTAPPTATVRLGQTVYGGTLDVTAGTMTVDRTIIDCASIATWTIDKNAKRVYKIMSELVPASAAGVVANGLICNRFKSITANQIYANVEGVAISISSALQFRINGLTDNPDVTLADVNSYFTANETKVVAKLATPFEIALTPTQIAAIVGQTNNVWSDAGDVIVEFAADLKWYIDKEIAKLQALVLENGG